MCRGIRDGVLAGLMLAVPGCSPDRTGATDSASGSTVTTGVTTGGTTGVTTGGTTGVTSGDTGGTHDGTDATVPTSSATGSVMTLPETSAATTMETDTLTGSSATSTGAPLLCGNGVLDGDEACDDGNAVWSDGCEPDCKSTHIARLYAGGANTCALFESGRVRCWGVNWFGQLGQGHVDSLGDNEHPSEIPDIELGDVAVESLAIDQHTCVVLVGGALRCWGSNMQGELGYGHTENIGDDEPAIAAGDIDVGGPVSQVTVGENFTCALTSGAVRCWGRNYDGELGYATTDLIGDQPGEMPPPDVDVGGPAIQIAAQDRAACVLLADGAVRCWGYGLLYGNLGTGAAEIVGDDETPGSRPPLELGGPAVQLSTSTHSTCALMASGAVRCWGSAVGGQLGNGNDFNTIGDKPGELPPVDTNLGGEVVDVLCGGPNFTNSTRCFQLTGGRVRCFGNGNGGGLGNGSTASIGGKPGDMPPPDVDLGGPVLQLACGGIHSCALLAGDVVRCWGHNKYGDLGYAHILNIGDEPGEMPPPDVAVF